MPTDHDVESGTIIGGVSTYRPGPARDVDLEPFLEFARSRPLAEAEIRVFSVVPGFAYAHAIFPDGLRFTICLEGWQMIKLLISDQPFDIT